LHTGRPGSVFTGWRTRSAGGRPLIAFCVPWASPLPHPTAWPVGPSSSPRQSSILVATASNVGVFNACLAGVFTTGAFVGAVVVQVATAGVAPALLVGAPPAGAAAIAAMGSVYVYEAIAAAGGLGGGLFGTWLYSRRSPQP
jgi:hypothetical protein